ncbi:hypothetical protein [Natrinema longum]|uniref:Uncharacterized protein n=1 Tax=Natrinema longum TaxID=370324 RepID=A0A8A2UBP6_9EURY|nr:hypothetical protein [Natrinema longum]MBZ6495816.1 hypothetical protein [Natrinema longum]QSW86241.1 hypothetical protein J0X27_05320 [Natrinema longum]
MSTTYTPATNKPDKLLTGFISVRAPELKHIYGSLQGTTSVSEVTSKFGRPATGGEVKTDHVEGSLRFLNAVDLVESPTGDIKDTVEPINERHFEGLPFEARLLYHCNQQDGRQSHFGDVHRALLSEGSRTVNAGRDNLRTILKRETDYDFSWTDEKIDMWVTLCEQLGLVSETEDGLVLSPCRAMMYDALVLAPTSSGEDAGYDGETVENGEFRRALNWINDNLFTVYKARTGTPRLHPAIADVLRNMEEDGVLSLSAPGDAQNQVEVPPADLDDDVRGNRRSVTHVSIHSRPDETAYQYPLDQLLTHQ